jgi:hypothetical protein
VEISEVLVSLDHDRGTAAVVRYAGYERLWLYGSLERGVGSGIRPHQPVREGLIGGGWAYGGALPPGATAAAVIDYGGVAREAAVGGGAWVAIVPEDPLPGVRPVRYTAADGRIVAPLLPDGWQRTPVTDTDAVCPVCGESGWDEVTPDGDPDAPLTPDGNPFVPSPFRVCRTCGKRVHGDVLRLVAGPRPKPTHSGVPQHILDRMRLQMSEVRFPVYTAVGLTPHLAGSGGGSDGVHDVRVRAGDDSLTVASSTRAFQALDAEAREALWRLSDRLAPSAAERSDSAHLIESDVRGEQVHRAVAAAALTTLTLNVEGAPTEFVAVRGDDAWAAVADINCIRVTVMSRGVEPARGWLEQVDDPTLLSPAPA